jgi:hypothetical protein
MEIPIAFNGQWIQPRPKRFWMMCCDCRLVHRVNFRIVAGRRRGRRVRRVQFQAFRDKKETARQRRAGKYRLVRRRSTKVRLSRAPAAGKRRRHA